MHLHACVLRDLAHLSCSSWYLECYAGKWVQPLQKYIQMEQPLPCDTFSLAFMVKL